MRLAAHHSPSTQSRPQACHAVSHESSSFLIPQVHCWPISVSREILKMITEALFNDTLNSPDVKEPNWAHTSAKSFVAWPRITQINGHYFPRSSPSLEFKHPTSVGLERGGLILPKTYERRTVSTFRQGSLPSKICVKCALKYRFKI